MANSVDALSGFRRVYSRWFTGRDGLRPFGGNRIALIHGQPGVMGKHLRAFSTPPGEETQEVLFADVLSSGGGIDFRLAALNHAVQIVHVESSSDPSMQDFESDFQPLWSFFGSTGKTPSGRSLI